MPRTKGDLNQLLLPNAMDGPSRPLVKWAGGKSQLRDIIHRAAPKYFSRYVELFVGGGAMFWSFTLPGSLIADSNSELMNFYKVVRDAPGALLAEVHCMPITKEDYYRIRALSPEDMDPIKQAARFVYLNKTCFNGLYRVNRKGLFNTPFGARTSVTILDERDLFSASSLLSKTELVCADFRATMPLLREGDFVYLDPPYLPLGKYSDFRRYTREFFNEEHHVRLAIEFAKLEERGVKALLSNSATDTIRRLYKRYRCVEVMASRHINCNGARRGKIPELLVANYPLEDKNGIP